MDTETMQAAHAYAASYGKSCPAEYWVLSPHGVWIENPFYIAAPAGEHDAYGALLCNEDAFA